MVELPWDDAKTRFEELAKKFDSFALTFNEGAKGALADAMEDRVKAVNEFTSAVAMAIMDRPAASAAAQHAADEVLRDAPKPAEVRKAEVEAAFMTLRAKQSIIPLPQAAAYEQKAQELRSRRDEAYEFHTDASSVNAPNFIASPPPMPELANNSRGVDGGGHGDSGTSGYPGGNGGQGASGGGSGAGAPGSGSVTGGSGSGGGLGGGSVGDSEIGTETSADGLGAGAGGMQQPMMGQQPMQGQPQAGAAGANPAAFGQQPGMLGSTSPSAADAMRRNRDRKRDRDRDISTGLTGAAGGAAAVMGGAAASGVDRGVSVNGVNTKADTSGSAQTNLSGANGKPPGTGGAGGPGGMMRGGGMMGGPMGSGAQQANSKEKPDIKPGIKDAALHGYEPLKDAIPGGVIGSETAEPEDETGVDRFFDKEDWDRKSRS